MAVPERRDVSEDVGRRRRFDRWRLISPTGAEVVSLRQLSKRERLRVTAPTFFTIVNMMSGLSSVLLAFRGEFTFAAVLIAVSILMDIADGGVARLVGATSPFGLQMDSLADLIAFGFAPAILVHTWALPDYPILSWLAAFFWLGCAAFRLARFNVTIDPTADKRYFVGLPSPAAAAVVMATIFALNQPEAGGYDTSLVVPVIVSFVPAVLMVTSIRFRSFRNLLSPQGRTGWITTTLAALAIIAGLVIEPGLTGLVIAYGYILQAPLGVLTAPVRERLFGTDAVAPRRERMPSVFLPDTDEGDDGAQS
ncbi:CDP-diacylglycerol O-phosphatidyltransferase [Knoellia sp. Soil729]|nr:CDP-diacylglycerol O-phosphatidyltransferase [Knoellia sp. Soil729]